jgi:N-acyl-D-amino-acid deacylase
LQPPKGKIPDPRLAQITVRMLLQHTGGWDRDISGDPIGMSPKAARALNVPSPVTPEQLIRYMMGERLDFDPGSRFAYSNLGAIILARVIEKITGAPFEEHVKSEVLAPAGVRRMRLGRTLPSLRADSEVKYYDVPGAPLMFTQVRGGDPIVPAPYANPLETWEACGAWIASSIDLVRFALSLNERSGRLLLLRPSTIQMMLAERVALNFGVNVQTGLGWFVWPYKDGDVNWGHTGGLAGSSAALISRPDGIVYGVVFNSHPWAESYGDLFTQGDSYEALNAAIDSIQEWPEVDLFEVYQ